MSLKSLDYLAFVLTAIVIYYLVYRIPKAQKYVILVANLYFIYQLHDKKSILAIIVLIIVTYVVGLLIDKCIVMKKKKMSRILMWGGVL